MTRHGDTCGICGQPIEDVNEMVMASARPWEIWDIEPDTVHRACANALVHEIETTRVGDEASYVAGIADIFRDRRGE